MSLGLFDLTGKRALVTGSSQGIGLAIAEGLAAAGAEIILNGRNKEKLASAVAGLKAKGFTVHGFDFDVTLQESVASGINMIEAEFGSIDIMVNNAGMQFRAPLEDFPAEKFRELMTLNVESVFLCAQSRGPPHDQTPARQDHQYLFSAKRTGAARHCALHSNQGCGENVNQGHGGGLGQIRHSG